MRVKFKTKILFVLILICTFTTVGFFAAYRIFKAPKQAAGTWIVPNVNTPSRKFINRETLVNQIQQKQELIPLEVELTAKVTIDNSWGNLEPFKKLQNVYFVAKAWYSIDMSKMHLQNITVDNEKSTIKLIIPKPLIKTISIDEKKTVYETPQNGFLRFGDIKLSAAEYQIMIDVAKNRMTEKLNSSEFYDQALQSTEAAVANLVKTILSDETNEDYNIVILFEN
jgi:hypothetical protein